VLPALGTRVILADFIEDKYIRRLKPQRISDTSEYIFVGLDRSLNLENLARRVIAPKLEEAGVE